MTNRHLSTAENHELCLIRFQQEIVLKAPGSFFFSGTTVFWSYNLVLSILFFFYFYFLIFGIWYLDTSFCRYFDI